jgi:predicted nucleic acid-binding protein
MRWFLDTSVLVAGCVRRHPHFHRARPLLQSIAEGTEGVVSCHSLAETFAALTSLPLTPRILPAEAEAIIAANILPRFHRQAVTDSMYARAMQACVRQSLPGGRVYDALLIECAREAACDRLYTFNVVDFQRLAPDLTDRISAP